MAALSWVFNVAVLGVTPTGDYTVEAKCTISDPALPMPVIGTGTMSVVATLDGNAPAGWATAIENAVIAQALADYGVTVTTARAILPTFN
jgi:hypothetical protein